jgi:hypothetical protein
MVKTDVLAMTEASHVLKHSNILQGPTEATSSFAKLYWQNFCLKTFCKTKSMLADNLSAAI